MKEDININLTEIKNEKLRTRWIHYHQTFKELTPILHNLLPKMQRKDHFPTHFMRPVSPNFEPLRNIKEKIKDQYLQIEKFPNSSQTKFSNIKMDYTSISSRIYPGINTG